VERDRLSLDRDRTNAERARSNAERARANAERGRIAAEWDRFSGVPQLDWRLGDLDLQLQNLHLPDFDFDFDFDFDPPDFDFPELEHLNNLHIDIPDVQVDLDALNLQLDAVRNMDVAGIARDARERAAMALAQLPTPAPVPPAPPAPPAMPFVFGDSRSPEGLYDQARSYIDRDQYERAVDVLNRLIGLKGTRTDAAMYWKAYSLSKLARNPEALTTLQELRKQFGSSSWIRDAGFLEIEVRQASGQAVNAEAQVSEDMKLLALQGIMRSDPDTAIPVVEKTLAGNSSVRVKERALFVLSQSRAPRARDVVIGVARTGSNPDLRVSAIRYMGRISGPEVVQALDDIYKGSSDVDVKRAAMQALVQAKAVDRLGSIARSEKDRDLRRAAIRQLGSSNTPEAAESLRTLYVSESDVEVKRTVLDSLSSNRGGAAALVALARTEKDATLKTEIVRRLSNSRAPEAVQYMMEILK
jgi:HEAT repeat protein